jgi:hypothetical protein
LSMLVSHEVQGFAGGDRDQQTPKIVSVVQLKEVFSRQSQVQSPCAGSNTPRSVEA